MGKIDLIDSDLKQILDEDQGFDRSKEDEIFEQFSARNSLNNNPSCGSPVENINIDDYKDVMNNNWNGDDGT